MGSLVRFPSKRNVNVTGAYSPIGSSAIRSIQNDMLFEAGAQPPQEVFGGAAQSVLVTQNSDGVGESSQSATGEASQPVAISQAASADVEAQGTFTRSVAIVQAAAAAVLVQGVQSASVVVSHASSGGVAFVGGQSQNIEITQAATGDVVSSGSQSENVVISQSAEGSVEGVEAAPPLFFSYPGPPHGKQEPKDDASDDKYLYEVADDVSDETAHVLVGYAPDLNSTLSQFNEDATVQSVLAVLARENAAKDQQIARLIAKARSVEAARIAADDEDIEFLLLYAA